VAESKAARAPEPVAKQWSRKTLLISLLALAIPVASTAMAPQSTDGGIGLLVWILPLVPAFFLSFRHGWKGASVALAAGMAALALSEFVLAGSRSTGPRTEFALAFIVVLIVVSLGGSWVAASFQVTLERVRDEALIDHGTGLPNRRAATAFLEKSFFAAQRGARVSVVLFDLDRFKAINDGHGHAAGDRVLAAFAQILAHTTRAMNLSARYGGEEFISVVNDSNADGAAVFAERIRAAFEEAAPVPGATVSAGVAEYEPGMAAPDVLVAAADQALYRAKNGGRNRVEVLGRMGRRADPLRAESGTRSGGRGQRVLVVDDDQPARRGIARGLHRFGYSVLEADSAAEALEIVEGLDDPIDLVVTDIVMPETSGFRLMQMISEIQPEVRAVYVSGYSQDEVDWAGVPGVASGFISKPVLLDDLNRVVAEVLERPASGGAPQSAPAERAGASPGPRPVREEPLLEPALADIDSALLGDRIVVLNHAQSTNPSAHEATLRRFGFRNVEHAAGLSGLAAAGPWHLVVADLAVAGGSADNLIELFQGAGVALLLVAGDESQETRVGWMRHGLIEVLPRPVDGLLVATTARNLLRIRRLRAQLGGHRDSLHAAGAARSAEMREWGAELVRRLAQAAEYRDEMTADHAERVGRIAAAIASELGWPRERRDLIEEAAILHDVGKIAVPDAVLRKPDRLTPAEFLIMQEHTTIGANILSGSRNPIMMLAEEIAYTHHERWDGTGYPTGRRGVDIPESGRIVAVADSFDTMIHLRPYRAPLTEDEAVAQLQDQSGNHFDPSVVNAFLRVLGTGGLRQVMSGSTVAFPDRRDSA
jgi:putative two-component system response regulator